MSDLSKSADPFGFAVFKAETPARELFRALGLLELLETAQSWQQLRILVVHFNGKDEGLFVKLARRRDRTCSASERVLLHAVLYVTDFAWLADELARRRTWQQMDDATGAYRRAVAACIAAELY